MKMFVVVITTVLLVCLGACGRSDAPALTANEIRLAAEGGDPAAQFSLGQMYKDGEGVPEDNAEAVRWYRQAADQGHADAQFSLGQMYANGEGVPADDVQAHFWYNVAAANGHEKSRRFRDETAQKMSREQIGDAQQQAREWWKRWEWYQGHMKDWVSIQQAKADLDTKRKELSAILITDQPTEDDQTAIRALKPEVNKMAEDFAAQLNHFISGPEIYQSKQLSEIKRAAADMRTNEDWISLQQAKADLDAKRQEIKELRDRVSRRALQAQVNDLTDSLGAKLAQFINDQTIRIGSELTEVQAQAIRMKSDEDMLLAQEYIDKGGEYQRALDIFNRALALDPENEKLATAIAKAEALRYMTEDRLAQVKKNMTKEEVRELLGTPKAQNVREFDGRAIGWFYPKEEPNTAAAVFFQKIGGEYRVYKADFNAIN